MHVVERIPWPKHGYTGATWHDALASAYDASYDVALIPSEEPQAYTFARKAAIPQRVGFYNGWQKPFKSWWARGELTRAVYRPASPPRVPRHECEVLFELGMGLHDERTPTRDLSRLRPCVLDHPPQRRPAIVQLTAKWLARGRDEALVAGWLRERRARGACTAIAARAESELALRLAADAGLSLELCDSVRDWKAIVAGADVLITPDSGAAHVAGMVGTPCVDLFEAADFERQRDRWRPWAGPACELPFPTTPAQREAFSEKLFWRA
ncbi:MAG: hypothetical protein JOZ38_12180 [Candidatus Eremiobacteraeota bacterium]|nr:hypothetical protein [Candidatus Eremiobacteraeota bacterium]